MPDTDGTPAVAEGTKTSEQVAEEVKIKQSDLEDLLNKAADAATEKILSELKKTDPATRPKMPGAPAPDDERDGPGYSKAELDSIHKAQRFMPAGTVDIKSINEGFAIDGNAFYKGVNMNTAPRGEIMENFSVGRLCYAINSMTTKGVPLTKYAPWEASYYNWVEKAQGESNGQD